VANFSLLAKLGLDSQAFGKGLKQSEGKVNKFKGAALSAFSKVAAGLVTVGLGKKIIQLSMNAEETASKFDVVLGGAADRVNSKIQELRKTIPATTQELQNSVATVMQMGLSFGMSSDAAEKFSLGITKMSADMASFNNLDPEEMFVKMAAAISGEFEPLKRLGIVINEAAIKSKGLSMGLTDGKSAVDAATKAIIVQNIVLDQMGKQLGDAARTQKSSANQTKFLKAKITELATEFGDKLRPMVVAVLEKLHTFADFVKTNAVVVTFFTKRLVALLITKKALNILIPALVKGYKGLKGAFIGSAVGATGFKFSLIGLKRAIQGVLASTGIGLLAVALGEIAIMALDSATKVKDGADEMGDAFIDLEAEMAETMGMVESATSSLLNMKNAQDGLTSSTLTATEALAREAEQLEHIRTQVDAAFAASKRAREDRGKRQELKSIELRSEGLHDQADALDRQIDLYNEMQRLADRYNLNEARAMVLAKRVRDNAREEEEKSEAPDVGPADMRRSSGGINSLAAIGAGGMVGALRPIEKGNEIAQSQLETLRRIEANTSENNPTNTSFS